MVCLQNGTTELLGNTNYIGIRFAIYDFSHIVAGMFGRKTKENIQ